jgi:high-affinity iron transporter
MHVALLGVQWAVAEHDSQSAQDQLATAFSYYEQQMRPALQVDLPKLVTTLDTDFSTAREQINSDDAVGVAQSTSNLWTHFLQAVTQMTLLSIQRNDPRSAADWLLLRETRPSDGKSGSRLDASAEIYALMGQRRDPADVYTAVRAELYDAYQARLNDTLVKADTASEQRDSAIWVQQAALASGYFGIVAPSYDEQYGQVALADMQTHFDALTKAAVSGDKETYKITRQTINMGLNGFVAAPLTDLELSRTAGLMMRYLTLIPVEYSKAVNNGDVVNETDYTQAVEYLQEARVGFVQLKPTWDAGFSTAKTDALTKEFDQLDYQIQARVAPADLQVRALALTQTIGDMLPTKWRSINSMGDIQAIRAVLEQVRSNVRSGDYEAALVSCTGAYSVLQQTLGQKLLAFAPDIALKMDALLWQGEPDQQGLALLIATGAGAGEIEQEIARLNAVLDEAEFTLSGTTSPEVVFGNTAVIVFREGLEAILILVALLGNLRVANAIRVRNRLLIGALLACVLAALSGWLVSRVLNAFVSQQNQLVALVSLLTVVVMLLITNWFFHRIYWTRHLSNLHTQKANTLALGGTIGILVLGFISVYREAFETALFLQPLALTAGNGLMLLGLVVGLITLLIVGGLVFVLNKRLPYKHMLTLTGILMVLVLVSMAGKTVYALQIVSWMPITPMGLVFIPRWLEDWLGVYPTWQGIILQVAAGGFIVVSYFCIEYRSKRRRESKFVSIKESQDTIVVSSIESHT